MSPRSRIAVIGAGISGITAAFLLQKKYSVSLFEKNSRLGGHTNTITVPDGPDAGLPVDTGFIVFNDKTYPLFTKLLQVWNVESQESDMSFSYWNRLTGLTYAGSDLNGLFADRKNLLSLRFLKFLNQIRRFNSSALSDLENNAALIENINLKTYIESLGLSEDFARWYLLPMASAIWSSSQNSILDFPAATFLRFFFNHGLLHLTDRPQWKVIRGGSSTYLTAFQKSFSGEIRLNEGAQFVERNGHSVSVFTTQNRRFEFDSVVVACHADEALQLLKAPTEDESRILGSWKYSVNRTFLHTDFSFMPPNKRAWASWNYIQESDDPNSNPVTLTYDMNRLQRLKSTQNYFVTLNPLREIPRNKVLAEILYTHPQYNLKAISAQRDFSKIQGTLRTYYCGAHCGYGFHEDGVRSGVSVALQLGVPFE